MSLWSAIDPSGFARLFVPRMAPTIQLLGKGTALATIFNSLSKNFFDLSSYINFNDNDFRSNNKTSLLVALSI